VKENPLRTTGLIDSPIPRDGEGDSRSDKALAFALKSTTKIGAHSDGNDGKSGGSDCPKGTVPMPDSEGTIQCVGVGENEVTVSGSETDELGFDPNRVSSRVVNDLFGPLVIDEPKFLAPATPEVSQILRKVEVCSRPADLTSAGINWNFFGINHQWIRTGQIEAGAGPEGGGVPGQGGSDSPFFTQMTMNDHSGQGNQQGSTCRIAPGADVNKVNSDLRLGQNHGIFGPLNNCQTVVNRIIRNASPAPPPQFDPLTRLPVGTRPQYACPYPSVRR